MVGEFLPIHLNFRGQTLARGTDFGTSLQSRTTECRVGLSWDLRLI